MKRNRLLPLLFIIPLLISMNMNTLGQKDRSQLDDSYKWDLTNLYTSDEAWSEAKESIVAEIDKIETFKGNITKSAGQLLALLEYGTSISKEASKLRMYSSMHADLDTRDMKYLGMKQEFQQVMSDYSARSSFIRPEILAEEWSVIEGYLKSEPKLEIYEKVLKDIFRMKDHTPGEAEGWILGLSGMVSGVSGSVYSTFQNAEMPNPEVTLSDGKKVVLDSPGFGKYRAVADRGDREKVFESFFSNYGKFRATYGELLYGNIKKDIYYAKAKNYSTALESSLHPNSIPVEVYHALVENVNKNLPTFHRYLKIKQRMLNLDTLKYSDLYAPVVKDVDLKYNYDEAKEIMLKAFAPLGEEYVKVIKQAYNERWIDVYPSTGKRSGAYSSGSHYDGHPYILLNYNDQYSDMSTAAHELGHTMHSYFSNKNQPYPKSNYTTFVAEVASTFNEVLLFDHIMENISDDETRLSLLMDRLNGFKGTLFRQTQFAEYELKIHEAVEKGIPLTGDYLSDLYLEIVKKYYGHDKDVCFVDDFINMEWAYIPHFYYNFYVYQYSTSFTASISLAKSVLDGEEGAQERYLEFLGSGGSDYPIELLKRAGVDMTGPEVFTKTIEAMEEIMDEIEKILD